MRPSCPPTASDLSSVPDLSRPFVIYGRNNEPYFVQARPLVEESLPHLRSSSLASDDINAGVCDENRRPCSPLVSNTSSSREPDVSLAARYAQGVRDGVNAVASTSLHSNPGPHLAHNQKKRLARKRNRALYTAEHDNS
ncbi:hypothetical protein QCA50_017780 [Cerrena zonata]|uniref:Uncharacterized protein n=1 Tax=Cerrena zonata TaxID=2478898 RepID=A0AAW0FIN1_9APHY